MYTVPPPVSPGGPGGPSTPVSPFIPFSPSLPPLPEAPVVPGCPSRPSLPLSTSMAEQEESLSGASRLLRGPAPEGEEGGGEKEGRVEGIEGVGVMRREGVWE